MHYICKQQHLEQLPADLSAVSWNGSKDRPAPRLNLTPDKLIAESVNEPPKSWLSSYPLRFAASKYAWNFLCKSDTWLNDNFSKASTIRRMNKPKEYITS